MNIESPVVANLQPSKCVEPGNGALYHPPVPAKPFARLNTAPRNTWDDAAVAARVSKMSEVISLVRMELLRPPSGSTSASADRWNCVYHRLKHLRIMDIRRRDLTGKRHTSGVYNKMMLGPEFASVGRVGARSFAPPLARTLLESTAARSNLNRFRRLISTSRTSCIFCQMPASCHSCRRRQQLIPHPQPISSGRCSQGIPVFNTNRIPVSAARSGTRGLPPSGYSLGFGSSGTMSFHSLSGTNFFAMGKTYQEIRRSTTGGDQFC